MTLRYGNDPSDGAWRGGASNSHYNGNAQTYMDVGEAMGKAMVELTKNE